MYEGFSQDPAFEDSSSKMLIKLKTIDDKLI